MSKNAFQHVRSGEPLQIPAVAYNAMLDAAQAHGNRRINHAPHGNGFGSLFVHIVNKSGTFLRKFDVVGLDGAAEQRNFNEFRNRIVFRGVIPAKRHKGKFAVLQEDAAPNMVVRACVYGVTQAVVRVESHNDQPAFCDIAEGVTDHLVSGNGAEILWSDQTSSYRWSLIRIGGGGGAALFPVKLDKVGGEQGDDTKVASWTYKVTDALTDEVLGEDISPTASPHQWRRPGIGALREATFGYAHRDKDDKFVLGWINEILHLEKCDG